MSQAAGKLQHRIVIEEQEASQDSNGDTVKEWTTFATVWAAIEPLSARDFISAQSVQSEVTARITIRALEGLKPRMRIVHRGKYYNIEGVLPDKASGLEYFTLPVSEGVNEG